MNCSAKFCILITWHLCASCPPLAPDHAHADVYAVVVGVNELPDLHLLNDGRVRPLRGAEADAEQVAAILRERFNVAPERLMLRCGHEATRLAVTAALADLAVVMKPGDTLLFHFSGHGTQLADVVAPDGAAGDESDGLDEALCLFDARADGTGLLTDDDLGRMLDLIPANDVVVVLDCCHAGTGAKSLLDDDREVTARYVNWSTVVTHDHAPTKAVTTPSDTPSQPAERPEAAAAWHELTSKRKSPFRRVDAFFACQPEQSAYESRIPGSLTRAGLFSHFFWSAVADRAGDADTDANGVVSRREAVEFAIRRLDEDFNVGRAPLAHQTPMFQTDGVDSPFLPVVVP